MSDSSTQVVGPKTNSANASMSNASKGKSPTGVSQTLTDAQPAKRDRQAAVPPRQIIAPPTPVNGIQPPFKAMPAIGLANRSVNSSFAPPTIAKVSANGSSRRSHRIPSETLSGQASNQNAFRPAPARPTRTSPATAGGLRSNADKVVKKSTNDSTLVKRIGVQKTDPLVEANKTEQSQPVLASNRGFPPGLRWSLLNCRFRPTM